MKENEIARLFKHDFSSSSESFREDLLNRCLAVLGTDETAIAEEDLHLKEGTTLDDDVLDLLAAAGDPSVALQAIANAQQED